MGPVAPPEAAKKAKARPYRPGEMNKGEADYARELEQRQCPGEIVRYRFRSRKVSRRRSRLLHARLRGPATRRRLLIAALKNGRPAFRVCSHPDPSSASARLSAYLSRFCHLNWTRHLNPSRSRTISAIHRCAAAATVRKPRILGSSSVSKCASRLRIFVNCAAAYRSSRGALIVCS